MQTANYIGKACCDKCTWLLLLKMTLKNYELTGEPDFGHSTQTTKISAHRLNGSLHQQHTSHEVEVMIYDFRNARRNLAVYRLFSVPQAGFLNRIYLVLQLIRSNFTLFDREKLTYWS
jgi:hypothetical protein